MERPKQLIQVAPTNVSGFKVKPDMMFQTWLKLTYPLHKLTDKEIEVAATFLKKYFENKKNIIDDGMLNRVTFSTESRRSVRLELNMSQNYFQIMMRGLRMKGFIKNKLINPEFIPAFNEEGNIIHLFILKNEGLQHGGGKA